MRSSTALAGLMALIMAIMPATMAQDDVQALKPTCTSVIRQPGGCCPPITAHTSTTSIDCKGCALSTAIGPICDIICESTRTVSGPTTVTACATSTHIDQPITSINPGGPIQSCTSVSTSTLPFGCTVTEPAKTTTEIVDCHGCVLSTTTVVNTRLGVGPVCVGGRKTVTATGETATVTGCKASATAA